MLSGLGPDRELGGSAAQRLRLGRGLSNVSYLFFGSVPLVVIHHKQQQRATRNAPFRLTQRHRQASKILTTEKKERLSRNTVKQIFTCIPYTHLPIDLNRYKIDLIDLKIACLFYFTYRSFGGPSCRLNFIDKNWICGNFMGFFFFFFFFFSRAGRRRGGTQCLKIKQQRQRDRDRRGAHTAEAGRDEIESCARGRRAGHHVSRLRRIWKTLHRDQGEFRFPSPRPPRPPEPRPLARSG